MIPAAVSRKVDFSEVIKGRDSFVAINDNGMLDAAELISALTGKNRTDKYMISHPMCKGCFPQFRD